MAHIDYTARNLALPLCPVALVPLSIDYLDTSVVISGYTSPVPDPVRIGSAAMICDEDGTQEIVAVEAWSGSTLTIARGCCDTIPAQHAAGAVIWFFDDFIASDRREYAGNDTIGVKPLPRTTSGGPVPIASSPPTEITFDFRFAKPYAPGQVEINGDPWYTVLTMEEETLELITLTWAHRNRVTQADVLVDHLDGTITPEVGTTYRVDVYDDADVLQASYAGITGETWSYTKNQATIDSGLITGALESGYLILTAVRDGLDSWQSYRIDFIYRSSITVKTDLSLSWNVLGSAQQDRALQWDVL